MGLSRELAAKFSDYIIVLTEEDKLEFQRNLNLNCPIECIYNPIKISVSNESYKNDSKTILSVGRLTSQKGFDMLIDVAKIVFEQHPNWNWTILGEWEDRELLQNKIHEYNLADKIELVGNVSNVDEYYRSSSIFVLTSRYEGLGLVLLEAKSNKLPIVSFDCKFGLSEIIEDSENGYLVECFNINYMSEKICTLIENESLRLKFSEESYRKMDKFNPNSIVKKWEEVFDLLV